MVACRQIPSKLDSHHALCRWVRVVVCRVLPGLLSGVIGTQAVRADEMEVSHTRHRATLLVLRAYTPIPYQKSLHVAQQNMLRALFSLFVHEGGYFPEGAAQALGVEDVRLEETARLFRKLDRAKGVVSPGGEVHAQRPGALLLSLAIALTYSKPCTDGLHAAAHLARLGCDDDRTEAVAQATYALASFSLLGEEGGKVALLEKAAANTEDAYLARRIRGIQTTRWNRLPPESTIEGRFLRSLYVWFHQDAWAATIRLGRERLRHPESQWFLATFAAMWYDLHGLPEPLIAQMNENHTDTDCDIRLFRLAETGILLGVPETILDPPAPRTDRVVASGTQAGAEAAPQPPVPPQPPTSPEPPRRPMPSQHAVPVIVNIERSTFFPPPHPLRPGRLDRAPPTAPVHNAPVVGGLAPPPNYPDAPIAPIAPPAPQRPVGMHTEILHKEEPAALSPLAHPGGSSPRTISPHTVDAEPLPLIPAVDDAVMALPVDTPMD